MKLQEMLEKLKSEDEPVWSMQTVPVGRANAGGENTAPTCGFVLPSRLETGGEPVSEWNRDVSDLGDYFFVLVAVRKESMRRVFGREEGGGDE